VRYIYHFLTDPLWLTGLALAAIALWVLLSVDLWIALGVAAAMVPVGWGFMALVLASADFSDVA